MGYLDNFAQVYQLIDGVCTKDGLIQISTIPCEEAIGTGVSISGPVLIVLALITITFFGLWAFCFNHALRHYEIRNRRAWLIILLVSLFLLIFWLSSLIYFFKVFRGQNNQQLYDTTSLNGNINPYQQPQQDPYAVPNQPVVQQPDPYEQQPQNPYAVPYQPVAQQPPAPAPPQQQTTPPVQQNYPVANNQTGEFPPQPNQVFTPTQNPDQQDNGQ